jgi:hypothetical protein
VEGELRNIETSINILKHLKINYKLQCKLIFPSVFGILLLYELTNQLTDFRCVDFMEGGKIGKETRGYY